MFLSGNLAPVEQGMVTLNYYVIGLIERGDATCPYVALSSEMQPLLRGFKEELKDILEVLTRNPLNKNEINDIFENISAIFLWE